jgi:hypothetical protein
MLRSTSRRVADEEDVVLSALDSFLRGAAGGRYPTLHDRNNLWTLLVVITSRKVMDLREHQLAAKRGGEVCGESALLGNKDASSGGNGLQWILSREPSPEFALEVAQECDRLLDRLGDDNLRQIVLWKMEGFTDQEVAAQLNCAPWSERLTGFGKLGRRRSPDAFCGANAG